MHVNRVAWVVVVLGALAALSTILAGVLGAHVFLLAAGTTGFTVAATGGALKLQARENDKLLELRQEQLNHQQELKQRQEARRSLDRRRLDPDCAEVLYRAEVAVRTILGSDARAEDLLDPPVDENLLSDNVEAIWATVREICDLRAEHRSIVAASSAKTDVPAAIDGTATALRLSGGRPCPACRGTGASAGVVPQACPDCEATGRRKSWTLAQSPGPMTAAVIGPQQQYLAMVLNSVTAHAQNLERYAESVKAVDATYRDWIGAQQAEHLNERVRHLLASTVRDELAAAELRRLTERTAAAEQAFRHSIQEAGRAAETLALPDE